MTIHPFPKSVAGHAMSASLRDEALPVCDGSLAGIVHAIEPSGRAEAIPASFLRSDFKRADDTQQDQRHVPILVTNFRSDRVKGRDLITRAEQIRVAAILAERATADLLARAVQLRNSLTPHGDQSTMMELQRASKSLRESSNHVFA
jgi:hypothetical protein